MISTLWVANILHRGEKRERRKDRGDQLSERESLSGLCPEEAPPHTARKPGMDICSTAMWISTKS